MIARKLSELQELDYVLTEQQDMLTDIQTRLKGSRILILAREKYESAVGQVAALEKAQRENDAELEDIKARLKKQNDQLFSGKNNNPKELVGLEHEVETVKAQLGACEEKSLEILAGLEKARESVKVTKTEVAEAEADWSQDHDNLLHEHEALMRKANELEASRKTYIATLPSGALEIYQKASARRKPAVVKVERGRCLGCRIALSMAEQQRVRTGNLVLCSSCGRILYID